ncbi:hypothetical protein D3C86_1240050 [compost metagenome]
MLREWKAAFEDAYSTALRLFGPDKCFRKYLPATDSWKGAPSAPLSDAVLQAINLVGSEKLSKLTPERAQANLARLFGDRAFVASIEKGTNARAAIIYRVESVAKALMEV